MPYQTIEELPDNVRNPLPHHAQEIYKSAFNSALSQYGEEEQAHKTAWSSVKSKYEKQSDNKWHLK